MSRATRIERHTVSAILASIFGGALVTAFTGHPFVGGILGLASGVALFLTERADIEDEEKSS